jgi:hypothetical protein
MCDFVSWKTVERNGETLLLYLTDAEVFSEEGRKLFNDCKDNDPLGHGAIDRYYGLNGKGMEHEIRDFWNTNKLPKELAEKVTNFDAHWGKMFTSGCFQIDDLEYIVQNGPEKWKEKAGKQLLVQKFKLIKTIEFLTPLEYNHGKQLSTLDKKKFYFFNDAITDVNFQNVLDKFIPGKKYLVKFIGIGGSVTSEDCLQVYTDHKAFLVGAQGLSLLWQQKKEEFPVGKWSVSFDKKNHLYRGADGNHRVPRVYRDSDGDYEFDLGDFGNDWGDGYVLVLFCDCPQ